MCETAHVGVTLQRVVELPIDLLQDDDVWLVKKDRLGEVFGCCPVSDKDIGGEELDLVVACGGLTPDDRIERVYREDESCSHGRGSYPEAWASADKGGYAGHGQRNDEGWKEADESDGQGTTHGLVAEIEDPGAEEDKTPPDDHKQPVVGLVAGLKGLGRAGRRYRRELLCWFRGDGAGAFR